MRALFQCLLFSILFLTVVSVKSKSKVTKKGNKFHNSKKPNPQFSVVPEEEKVEPNYNEAKVIVCAIVSDEQLYIDEWLRYHRYLGFDLMYLYDIAEQPSVYLAGLHEVYGDFVSVKNHPSLIQEPPPAYRDCVDTFRHNNTWAAFIEVDEFIVLRKHDTIQSFLYDIAPKGGSVVLNWSGVSNSGIKTHERAPVVSRFTYTSAKLSHYVKSLSYLPHVQWVSSHNAGMYPGHPKVDVSGRTVPNIDSDWHDNEGNRHVAYVNHYHTKSLEEYTLKRHRGRDGQAVNRSTILDSFNKFNTPLHEVQDTFARDFYFSHFLSKNHKHPVTVNVTSKVHVAMNTTII